MKARSWKMTIAAFAAAAVAFGGGGVQPLSQLLGTAAEAASGVAYVYRYWDSDAKALKEETRYCYDYWSISGNSEDDTSFEGKTGEDKRWHVADVSKTFNYRVTVTDNVAILLCDGVTLTFNDGIHLASGSTLEIYCQSGGTGKLIANADTDYNAAIGGNSGETGGTVRIYGGSVTANAYDHGANSAGIGGGAAGGSGGTVEIYGGTVTATGCNSSYDGGAGIGGGNEGSGGTCRIYGGTVTATGGGDGAGIGGGDSGNGGTVEIYGGTVTASSLNDAAGIGGGEGGGAGGNITISGGTVNATGGDYGAGIGGGHKGNGGNVTISGGKVTATGGYEAAGIGGGYNGIGGTININGGIVHASGGDYCDAGIGGGYNSSDNGSLSVTGMTVLGGNNANPTTVVLPSSRYKYMIVKPHPHEYTYYVSGSTMTAICGQEDCSLFGKVPTLTLSAADAVYNGETYTGASVAQSYWTEGLLTVPEIEYSGRGDTVYESTTAAPTDAGTYTASIKAADGTAVSVDFAIAKSPNPAAVRIAVAVKHDRSSINLSRYVQLNGATGAVSYEIAGNDLGCRVDGSTLIFGSETGTVTVNVTVDGERNYEALPPTPITVTIGEQEEQILQASGVSVCKEDTRRRVIAKVLEPAEGVGAISYAVKSGYEDYITVDANTGVLTVKEVPADGKAYVTVTAAETDDCLAVSTDVLVRIYDHFDYTLEITDFLFSGGSLYWIYSWDGLIYELYDGDPGDPDSTLVCTVRDDTYHQAPYRLKASSTQLATHVRVIADEGDGRLFPVESDISEGIKVLDSPYISTTCAYFNYKINQAEPDFAAPVSKMLYCTGEELELVHPGLVAAGGTMQYAIGTDATTVPDDALFTASIPTASKVGTYYVWYRLASGNGCCSTEAKVLPPVTIEYEKSYVHDPVRYQKAKLNETSGEVEISSAEVSEYYLVDGKKSSWGPGTYVLKDNVTISDRITFSGSVDLILCDGAQLTAEKGFVPEDGAVLNIYAQENGTGKLTAHGENGTDGAADASGFAGVTGDVNVFGGEIEAYGGNGGTGYGKYSWGTGNRGGNGGSGLDGDITVYRGSIKAVGGNGGEGGEGHTSGRGGNGGSGLEGIVRIYGGTLELSGGTGGAAGRYSKYSGGTGENGAAITAERAEIYSGATFANGDPFTLVPKKAATFTETGIKAHYTATNGTTYGKEGNVYTPVTADELIIPMLEPIAAVMEAYSFNDNGAVGFVAEIPSDGSTWSLGDVVWTVTGEGKTKTTDPLPYSGVTISDANVSIGLVVEGLTDANASASVTFEKSGS